MTLPNVLRIVALLVVVMVVGEYVVLGELLIPPFVLAAVLFALSFAGNAWPAQRPMWRSSCAWPRRLRRSLAT